MSQAFACPECGARVSPSGHSPGRQIRCARCKTLVEVPFLPRAAKRRRRKQRPLRRLARGSVVLLMVLLVLWGVGRFFQNRARSRAREAIATLLDSSRSAEQSGRFEKALADAEAALSLAKRAKIDSPKELPSRRDELSRHSAKVRLDALDSLDPTAAVADAQALQDRAQIDSALSRLMPSIAEQLPRQRQRLARSWLDEANQALIDGKAQVALDLTTRVLKMLDLLPRDTRESLGQESRTLGEQVAEGYGVIVEPIQGRFTLGSARQYAQYISPMLEDALRQHGYLLRPKEPLWSSSWENLSSYRLTVVVNESQESRYSHSALHSSDITLTLTLSRHGETLWQGQVIGRTRVPPRGIPAIEAGRLATATHPEPTAERLLYNDALEVLRERLTLKLPGLPPAAGP